MISKLFYSWFILTSLVFTAIQPLTHPTTDGTTAANFEVTRTAFEKGIFSNVFINQQLNITESLYLENIH